MAQTLDLGKVVADTPYIGENGYWFIGETDTGVPAGGGSGTVTSVTIGDQTYAPDKSGVVDLSGMTAPDAAKLGGAAAGDYMKKTDRVAWEKVGSVTGSETAITVPACTEILICAMCRVNSSYSFSSIAFPYSYLDDSYRALYTYARDGYVRFLWNKGTVKLVSSEMDGTDATSTTTVEVYTR